MTLLWKRSNRYEKMWALLISACILAGGVAGCGNQAEPQGTVTQKVAEAPAKQDFKAVTSVKSGQKNVYAVVKAINGSYWKKVIAGMKKAGEENGINVYVGGVNKDGNWELQRAMLLDAQAKKADSIILGAADSMHLTETAKNLRGDKLPVVLVDTMMNTEDYDASYMTNNLAAGAEVAKKMVELLKESGVSEEEEITVVMHVSNLASRTISERLDSTIANWYNVAPKKWKISKAYLINYGDEQTAGELVEKTLQDQSVKGIIACNNSSTKATIAAVMKEGRKDLSVMGFDLSDPAVVALKDGSYHFATIAQNPEKMGYEAVMAAAALANGETVSERDVNTGIAVIDAKNFKG